MKRLILLASIVAIVCVMMPVSASATSYAPGFDGYTYIYVLLADPSVGPVVEFYDFMVGQPTSSQWASMLTGYSHQTIGSTDIYFLPDLGMSGIIYYNSAGQSTIVLLVPGNLVSLYSEPL